MHALRSLAFVFWQEGQRLVVLVGGDLVVIALGHVAGLGTVYGRSWVGLGPCSLALCSVLCAPYSVLCGFVLCGSVLHGSMLRCSMA